MGLWCKLQLSWSEENNTPRQREQLEAVVQARHTEAAQQVEHMLVELQQLVEEHKTAAEQSLEVLRILN
jgi:hypothetical protein